MEAGWFDDPRDPELLRYWDGTQWTTHTAPKYADGVGDTYQDQSGHYAEDETFEDAYDDVPAFFNQQEDAIPTSLDTYPTEPVEDYVDIPPVEDLGGLEEDLGYDFANDEELMNEFFPSTEPRYDEDEDRERQLAAEGIAAEPKPAKGPKVKTPREPKPAKGPKVKTPREPKERNGKGFPLNRQQTIGAVIALAAAVGAAFLIFTPNDDSSDKTPAATPQPTQTQPQETASPENTTSPEDTSTPPVTPATGYWDEEGYTPAQGDEYLISEVNQVASILSSLRSENPGATIMAVTSTSIDSKLVSNGSYYCPTSDKETIRVWVGNYPSPMAHKDIENAYGGVCIKVNVQQRTVQGYNTYGQEYTDEGSPYIANIG